MDSAPPDRRRLWARRIGRLVTLAALGFLIWELTGQWDQINDWRPGLGQVGMVIAMSASYGATLFLLAWNWVTILQAATAEPLPRKQLWLSYTKTQIAKYLPGNVLHLAGRHIYIRRLGVAHGALAKAAAVELVSLPAAAVIAIGLTLPFAGQLEIGPWGQANIIGVGVAVCLLLAAIILWRLRPNLIGPALLVSVRTIAFMFALGLIFAALLFSLSGLFLSVAIPAAVVAWLVGFLTPGAPGGLAVREAVLLSLLAGVAPSHDVLIAAILFRVVTTLGDLILYFVGGLLIADTEGSTAT